MATIESQANEVRRQGAAMNTTEGTLDRGEPAAQFAPTTAAWRTGLLAAILASAANVAVYAIARGGGVSFRMPLKLIDPDKPVVLPVEMVILASVIGAVAGTVVFALLRRFDPRHPRLFVVIGLGFLVLSLAGPLTLDDTGAATKWWLEVMHVVAGLTIIGLLVRSAPRQAWCPCPAA